MKAPVLKLIQNGTNHYIFLLLGAFDPTECINGIRQLYKIREGWLAPFPWCEEFRFSLDNIFTRLKMVSRKKERGTKTNESVTMNDIFRPHEECPQPRTVLIEGKPGMGKTTYCNKLAYDWATKNDEPRGSPSRFPKFQVVLSLKCRDIKSNLWDAIDEQLLPQDATKEEKEQFFQFVRQNQSGVLLILDGLDELSTSMLPAFKEIIQGRVISKCHIVVTARHEVGMTMRECCDSLLEIEGFTQEDARKFIVKYFKADTELAHKLLDKLEDDQSLKQLIANPLNAALLCLLCEDFNGNFPERGTKLYLEMIECVLRRYRRKKKLPKPDGEDLTEVYKIQLKQLGLIAWNGLLQDNMYFEESEFGNCSKELPAFGFLSIERGQSKLRPALYYSFLHKTFQELFAAFYLCDQLLEKKIFPETLVADDRYFHKLKQVLVFVCGMLASQSEGLMRVFVVSIADRVNKGFGGDLRVGLQCIDECKNDKHNLHLQLACTLGSLLQVRTMKLMFSFPRYGSVAVATEVIKHNSTIRKLDLSSNGLEAGDCNTLAEAIKHNSTITQLDLSDNDLGTTDFATLAEAIKHNSSITNLNLSHNELFDADCTALAEVIKHNSSLTQLNLSDIGLYAATSPTLAEAIKQNTLITQLNLSQNELSDGDCSTLAEAIKHNSAIRQLNLSHNKLGKDHCRACSTLAEAIKRNSTIRHLDLSNNDLGFSDCAALGEAIKHNSTITQLNLSHNELNYDPYDDSALADAIKSNLTIRHLDLSNNDLGVNNLNRIEMSKAITQNSTITHLNWSTNYIDDDDCTVLAEAITCNSALTQLNLSDNKLGLINCTALAEAIKQSPTITVLNLSRNRLGDGDCTALLEAIKHNSTITQLDLSDNEFRACDCCAVLAEVITQNSTITQLNLSYNFLGAGDCAELIEAVEHNSTLTQLNLSYNGFNTFNRNRLTEVIKHNLTTTHLIL